MGFAVFTVKQRIVRLAGDEPTEEVGHCRIVAFLLLKGNGEHDRLSVSKQPSKVDTKGTAHAACSISQSACITFRYRRYGFAWLVESRCHMASMSPVTMNVSYGPMSADSALDWLWITVVSSALGIAFANSVPRLGSANCGTSSAIASSTAGLEYVRASGAGRICGSAQPAAVRGAAVFRCCGLGDAAQGSAAFATPTFPSSGCDIGAASTEGASSSRPARHGATREFMQLPRPQGELGRMSYNSSPARLRADSTDDR